MFKILIGEFESNRHKKKRKKKRKNSDLKFVWDFFFEYFVVLELSVDKNSLSTYGCFTLDSFFHWQFMSIENVQQISDAI